MTRQHKQFIYFAFILVGFPLVAKVVNYIAEKRAFESQFSGRIEKLRFGDKGTAVITVNHEEHPLYHPSKYFKSNIEVGDSIVKLQNSKHYTLIKAQTSLVIDSDQEKAL
jgi:hypothetical protein